MHFDEKLTTIVVASVTPKMKGANSQLPMLERVQINKMMGCMLCLN